jgi:hypothetical protein
MEMDLMQEDWHLDLDWPDCLVLPGKRWTLQTATPLNVQHHEGSTAHIVVLGAPGDPSYPRDYIVVAAGRERISTFVAQTDVDIWSHTATGAVWDPMFPDLNQGRATQNLVILADGSLLAVGGADIHPTEWSADRRPLES